MRREIVVGYSEMREGWMVSEGTEVYEICDLKQDAERKGRSKAKSVAPSVFVVERKNGGVSYSQNYD